MFKFLPWRYIIRRAARRYGFMDPVSWLARLRAFAQHSEVQEPLELLRAGIVFHARGLVNVKAIQHNLDWVWPFWVERQFKAGDPSFVPRAFSFSHINLTHRNWTAVGLPTIPIYPIVDPRGLVTPLHDGWSLDFWIVADDGSRLLPSKLEEHQVHQQLVLDPNLSVETSLSKNHLGLSLKTSLQSAGEGPEVAIGVDAESAAADAWLIAAVRPYNPEGVQFIDEIELNAAADRLTVNKATEIRFDRRIEGTRMAHYADGDIYLDLENSEEKTRITCDAGMATAAAMFRLSAGVLQHLELRVPLQQEIKERKLKLPAAPPPPWKDAVKPAAALKIADAKMQFLYDAAVKTLILLSADELVPGPNTYRRFWFRDACLMLHPLLALGLTKRAREIIDQFPTRQNLSGYFQSQEGEWDSNGQVLWIVARYFEMTGERMGRELEQALVKGIRWLDRKRLPREGPAKNGPPGLLPAGFSAEHLGPNDFYYWDDFWAVGGLETIAAYFEKWGDPEAASQARTIGAEFRESIEASIAAIPSKRSRGAIPAAPSRRLDAGAIGSMVADYPLQLFPAAESRIMATADFLISKCFFRGGFFQEMIHSGINAYLTLDLAQTLLRAGDGRYAELIRAVADLASPTGQWPEAIHPNTLGGCMGDGQHGWAAGEWIMMIRNCFVREEEAAGQLVIGSGVFPEWIAGDEEASFGPTETRWGKVSVSIRQREIRVDASWREAAPRMRIAVPGHREIPEAVAGQSYPLESLTL